MFIKNYYCHTKTELILLTLLAIILISGVVLIVASNTKHLDNTLSIYYAYPEVESLLSDISKTGDKLNNEYHLKILYPNYSYVVETFYDNNYLDLKKEFERYHNNNIIKNRIAELIMLHTIFCFIVMITIELIILSKERITDYGLFK